jgi:nicotinate-nucleotide pyrophosphorylase (carboxylating)
MTVVELARLCLEEDSSFRDATTKSLAQIFERAETRIPLRDFVIIAKCEGVFSGARWIEALSKVSQLHIEARKSEGQVFRPGDVVCAGRGSWDRVLSTERTLLNELQHLCAIATLTRNFVREIDQAWAERGRQVVAKPGLYHTRKTLGLHRELEIEAVRAGGGCEHRRDLAGRVLFKENHKILAREMGFEWKELVRQLVEQDPEALIEVETLQEARDARASGARYLMLDNFTPMQVEEAVRRLASDALNNTPNNTLNDTPNNTPNNTVIEVSGGLRLDTIRNYVLPGVSRLSVGALTHGARSLDLSLDWA